MHHRSQGYGPCEFATALLRHGEICANETEAPEGGASALPVSSLPSYYTTVYFTLQLKYSHHKEIARASCLTDDPFSTLYKFL